MSYIRGTDHSEVLLFPEVIDDYITQDNPRMEEVSSLIKVLRAGA